MAAPWTHNDKNEMKDPINLEFRNCDLPTIRQVLQSDGWDSPLSFAGMPIAEDQYLHISNKKAKQDDQVCRPPRRITRRFHVRFWQVQGRVVASAHEDIFTPLGGHAPLSFEKGEKEVAETFVRASGWSVEFDGEDLKNFLQKPANNGFATVIRRL